MTLNLPTLTLKDIQTKTKTLRTLPKNRCVLAIIHEHVDKHSLSSCSKKSLVYKIELLWNSRAELPCFGCGYIIFIQPILSEVVTVHVYFTIVILLLMTNSCYSAVKKSVILYDSRTTHVTSGSFPFYLNFA